MLHESNAWLSWKEITIAIWLINMCTLTPWSCVKPANQNRTGDFSQRSPFLCAFCVKRAVNWLWVCRVRLRPRRTSLQKLSAYLCGLSKSLSFFLISILIFLFLTPSFGLCLPRVLYLSLTRILSPLHCLSVSADASLFDIRDQWVSCTNKGLLCVFVCVYSQLCPSVYLSASAVQTHAVTQRSRIKV